MFSIIPVRLYIYAAVVVAALAGFWGFGRARYKAGEANVTAQWTAQREADKTAALTVAANNAKETQRRITKQKENDDAQAAQIARSNADLAAAGAAANRLRQQADSYRTAIRRATGNPATGTSSTPTGNAVDVFADLFGRADKTAGELGAALDRSYAAGLRCERDYDALSK